VNFAITNDEHPMASLVASALRVFFALLRFGFSGTRNKARLYLSDVSKFRRLANITTGIPSRPMWWSYMIGAKFLAIACEIIKLEPGKFYASTIESSTTGGSTVQRQEVQRQEVQRHRRFNDTGDSTTGESTTYSTTGSSTTGGSTVQWYLVLSHKLIYSYPSISLPLPVSRSAPTNRLELYAITCRYARGVLRGVIFQLEHKTDPLSDQDMKMATMAATAAAVVRGTLSCCWVVLVLGGVGFGWCWFWVVLVLGGFGCC
jgi:hypothetical protein